jgi:G3E family GTPase
MSKVAVDIVTGFLGSGKTSLLKHVLAHGLSGKRVAVIMNEIGDIGIDGKVLTGFSAVEKMVEVDSGCICCSVSLQFAVAIQEIMEAVNPSLILLETTGAADPVPLIRQALAAGLALDAVISVVDAAEVLNTDKKARVVRRQVEAADFVVVNKVDLVDDKARRAVHKWVRKRNDRALIFDTVRGEVPTDLLFGTSVGRYREQVARGAEAHGAASHAEHAGGNGGHLADDDISAFVYQSARVLDRKRFDKFLQRLPDDVYRAKGVVRFAEDERPQLFNFTCGRFDFDSFPLDQPPSVSTQAVFIGRDIHSHQRKIEKALAGCEVDD